MASPRFLRFLMGDDFAYRRFLRAHKICCTKNHIMELSARIEEFFKIRKKSGKIISTDPF